MASDIEETGKSTLALACGVAGGVLGIVAGILAMLLGGAGMLITAEGAQIIWLGAGGIVLGLAGAVGGGLATTNPEVATLLMIVSGLGGFILVSLFWILPGALLLIGAMLIWSIRREEEPAPAQRSY